MTTYQRSTVYTSDDIRAIADHAGSHFFSADTIRFFSSRLLEGVYAPDGYEAKNGNRFFFITSERHDDNPRHYAVRMMTLGSVRDDRPAVDIITVGDYHDTASQARKEAQKLSDEIRYLDA